MERDQVELSCFASGVLIKRAGRKPPDGVVGRAAPKATGRSPRLDPRPARAAARFLSLCAFAVGKGSSMRSCTRIVGAAALAFAALLPSLAKADACEDPFHLADRAKVIEPCSARLADHDLTKDQRIRALEYRARGLRAAKRDDDALADINAGLALAEDAALYTVRAGIKRDRYDLEGAWGDGQRATHLEPDKVRHYEILINIAVFVHDFENAKALIDHATSLDDGNVALMIWRSFYHRHKGEAREAIEALDEALASPRSEDRKAFGIDWYGRRRDTDIVLRLLRGETLRQRHDWEKAANAIEEAVAFATNEVTLTERAYSKINSPMASGGMVGAEALADTDAALQLDPTYDRAHLTRGLALQVLKRPQ